RQLQSDLERTERESREADEHLKLDQDKAELWQAELLEIEPELALINEAEAASGDLLHEAEELMQGWQSDWDAFNQRAAEPRQRAEVQQSRIQHLEQVQQRLLSRIDKLKEEKKGLGDIAEDDSIDLIQESLAEIQLLTEEKQALLEDQA